MKGAEALDLLRPCSSLAAFSAACRSLGVVQPPSASDQTLHDADVPGAELGSPQHVQQALEQIGALYAIEEDICALKLAGDAERRGDP